jgi:hypothetical protein
MTDLVAVAHLLEGVATKMQPNPPMIMQAAVAIREAEYRFEAMEAIVGTIARKMAITIEDIGLPDLPVGGHGGRVSKSQSQRRSTTRQLAERILSSGQQTYTAAAQLHRPSAMTSPMLSPLRR